MDKDDHGGDRTSSNTTEEVPNQNKSEEMSEAFVVSGSSEFLQREVENGHQDEDEAQATSAKTSAPSSAAVQENGGTNGHRNSSTSTNGVSPLVEDVEPAPPPLETLLTATSSTTTANTAPTTTTTGSSAAGSDSPVTRPGAVAVAAPRPSATSLKDGGGRRMVPPSAPSSSAPSGDASPGDDSDAPTTAPGAVAIDAPPPPLVKGNRAMLTADEMAPPRRRNETTNTGSLLDDSDDDKDAETEEQRALQRHANVMKPMDSSLPRAEHPGAVAVSAVEEERQQSEEQDARESISRTSATTVPGNHNNESSSSNGGGDAAEATILLTRKDSRPGAVPMTPASPELAALNEEETKKEIELLNESNNRVSRDSDEGVLSSSIRTTGSVAMVLGNYDAAAPAVEVTATSNGTSNIRGSTSSTNVARRPPNNENDEYVDEFAANIPNEFFLPRSVTQTTSEARDSEIKAAAASGRSSHQGPGVARVSHNSNNPDAVHVVIDGSDQFHEEDGERAVSFSRTHGDIPTMISATFTPADFDGVGNPDEESDYGSGPLTVAGGESVGATTITRAWGVEEDQKRLEELEKQALELKNERENAPRAEIVRVESSRKRDSMINMVISRWKTRFVILLVVVLILIIVGATVIGIAVADNKKGSDESSLDDTGDVLPSGMDRNRPIILKPTLEAIRERGYINCRGVPQEMETGVGFSADMCAAMSAAIFQGDASRYEFVKMPFAQQFAAIGNGTVDLSTEETTHTMQRDIREPLSHIGFTFSNAFFFSGTMFAGIPEFVDCADRGETLVGSCRDLSVCVLEGSVTEIIVQNHLGGSVSNKVSFSGDMFARLSDGTCNVITSVPLIITEQRAREAGYTGPYVFGTQFFSRDPLALTTRNDDPQFGDLVNWVLRALVVAETLNITQATADQFPTTDLFGEENSQMFQHAIAAVGNYGELYERWYEDKVERGEAGMNTPHLRSEDGGLLYPNPLGNIGVGSVGANEIQPAPVPNGTLDTINQRQQLYCGIVVGRPGLADWNETMNAWSGIDVDYCKGLASAVFGGGDVHEALVLMDFETLEEGFAALANKELDVMSGATYNMMNDVREPTTEQGFTFGSIYYYHNGEVDQEPEGTVWPLAMATREDDVQWSDFVRLISLSAIHAEANGITQQTAINMPTLELFGPLYRQAMRDVVLWIGNSADIYERNMEQYIPRVENRRNTLHSGGTPLFYANWKF